MNPSNTTPTLSLVMRRSGVRFSEAAPKTRGSEQPDSENFSNHVSDVCGKADPGAEALAAMPAMLREIREVMFLDDDGPRRIAAMAEKQRVLDLIALDRAYHTAVTSL
jgi:hypothetical protein